MDNSPIDPELQEQLRKLQQKYAAMGQDLSSYLDGLLYSDYLTYWDYIHLDTLLSLQTPKTHLKDEKIFIVYHQITELYFNLILWELKQLSELESMTENFLIDRLERVIRYFRQLTSSFSVMTDGMEREQFLRFRMALLPASGFQSAQYRLIELQTTDMINLVAPEARMEIAGTSDLPALLEKLYWRQGATELASGKKTLTLKQFEEKYLRLFLDTAIQYRDNNLLQIYRKQFKGAPLVIERLRELDLLANVHWPLAHMKSASRYLHKSSEDIKATGGTNWQKYLPPSFQKITFFPELWSDEEILDWGKPAVLQIMKIQ